MGIVAVSGDVATTTALALASGWPLDDVLVVEADPSGGDLAAWLDLPESPSLSTIAARVPDGSWPRIEPLIRSGEGGLRLIPSPSRPVAAGRAIDEAARACLPTLAAIHSPVTIADAGRGPLVGEPISAHPVLSLSAVTVVVHRQATQSARAAAVRLQRLTDRLEQLSATRASLVVAIVGTTPFTLDDIAPFVTGRVGDLPVVALPVDALAAAVLGGRTGVSTRRLRRLPLLRAGRELATVVERALAERGATEASLDLLPSGGSDRRDPSGAASRSGSGVEVDR